jgi:hypothetical protein
MASLGWKGLILTVEKVITFALNFECHNIIKSSRETVNIYPKDDGAFRT